MLLTRSTIHTSPVSKKLSLAVLCILKSGTAFTRPLNKNYLCGIQLMNNRPLTSAKKITAAKVLIVDQYGMLSKLYRYATISYIGGGFNSSGIHNTLEAAVWGRPVFFGPNYQKFREARGLIAAGAAFSVSNAKELKLKMSALLENTSMLETSGKAAKNYVEKKYRRYWKDTSIHSGKPSSHQVVKMSYGFAVLIPIQFKFQLTVHPVFGFGIDIK